MSKEEKVCSTCGYAHAELLSDKVIAIYDRIMSAPPEDRSVLMYELVNAFALDRSPTDMDTDESVHNMLIELSESRARYEHAVFRLARIIMRTVPVYRQTHPKIVVADIRPPPSNKAN